MASTAAGLRMWSELRMTEMPGSWTGKQRYPIFSLHLKMMRTADGKRGGGCAWHQQW
jgi:hypothetical protein